jgi:hypothetical protein
MMASRYAHAKQFKRHHRQLRLLRSRLGRIIRDIRRKITGRPELEAIFEAPMARAAQIRSQQQRQRGWKLYSFHAPEVGCIIYEGMRIAGLPEGRSPFRVRGRRGGQADGTAGHPPAPEIPRAFGTHASCQARP